MTKHKEVMTLNIFFKLWGFAFLFTTNVGLAQPKPTDWKDLEKLLLEEPRPVVVFLYTDWCSYCALMEKKAFRDERVIKILDNNYYYISFNAEQRDNVIFGSKTYKFIPKGIKSGTHELAKALSTNEVYPTMVVLDKKLQMIYRNQSYIRSKEMWGILERFLN